jgi:hypothetical protein
MTERRYRAITSEKDARRVAARASVINRKPRLTVVASQAERPPEILSELAPIGPSPDF